MDSTFERGGEDDVRRGECEVRVRKAGVEGGALGFAEFGEDRIGDRVIVRNIVERLSVPDEGDDGCGRYWCHCKAGGIVRVWRGGGEAVPEGGTGIKEEG